MPFDRRWIVVWVVSPVSGASSRRGVTTAFLPDESGVAGTGLTAASVGSTAPDGPGPGAGIVSTFFPPPHDAPTTRVPITTRELSLNMAPSRSEERRVGEECRSRRSPY